jgi:hypothetical protein
MRARGGADRAVDKSQNWFCTDEQENRLDLHMHVCLRTVELAESISFYISYLELSESG